ncbi:MAG: hypothetical protein HQ556_02825 [Candidatus Marinimicrobia bacterium]|nr:hypothetical protein [Candidatus Neomarinimicrobiota bacterium]
MELFQKKPLTIDDINYEIRILYNESTINVVAFLNDYPANGYRHQIQIPRNCNIQAILRSNVVGGLVEISQNDIIEKKAEILSKLIHDSMKNN